MLVYSADFTIIDANDAATRLIGDDVIGRPGMSILHPDDVAMGAKSVEVVTVDPSRSFPGLVRVIRPDGTEAPVTVYLTVLRSAERDPAESGPAYVSSLVPADAEVALHALTDALLLDLPFETVSSRAIAYLQARGLYGATVHYRSMLGADGSFDRAASLGIERSIDVHASLLLERIENAAAIGEGETLVPNTDVGLEETMIHDGLLLRSVTIFPLRNRFGVFGALGVWSAQLGKLGPAGFASALRVSRMLDMAGERQIALTEISSRRSVEGMEVDLATRVANVLGREVRLTPVECSVLGLLIDARGGVVSRERIVEHLTGSNFVGSSRSC